MDRRTARDLDNWITGHYGEDQFRGADWYLDSPNEFEQPDELQNLLRCCFEMQEERRIVRQANILSWAFVAVFGAAAVALYLVKFNHWFGIR